ncbi:phenylalanine--tRNA ligase subunit beta [Eubacterium sp.]|jgi:phenylalanyl-tRNA synthetase beta chain|uniref:phenylalanine--tRNA ligase subunit beta n=1 Tax=Eubacterium sp. TaxID=142586 RepID=UPI001DE3D8F5|nr:phenylalanine--tRNA ligase subunit beta [Eubacterium sp.]MBS5619349.1 phenylalanine--tRNA ligase subunit beta [Eubacterium sp.]
MNTPLSWIKAYVPDLECTDQEYMDAMTLSGTKCEGFERLDADLDKIVVGQIEKIEKHPDADKLVICQVNIGTETTQIVTGATNVKEGLKVPVVLDGGRVAGGHDGKKTPGGIKIKKGKLRGVESNGMMCSIEELGSTTEFYPEAPENGIYIFDDSVEVGADAVEVLGLHDTVFEYEITSNRVDCYSVLGIAREAAATFRKPFVAPEVKAVGTTGDVNDYIKVEVKDAELCPRYCAKVVKNVKIAPSPEWMQRRLSACGIRPINNLVDITNYVMEEFGQPMHAYDLSTIKGNKIVVRRAEDGEKFTTLDGQERTLDRDMLMICDEEKAIGLAGIMGGENSMITDDVQDMLFEAACFDGTNIRLSSKRVGLRTDASGKFEKGLDPNNAEAAINRACQLIEELGAGEVVEGMVDFYPEKKEEHQIKFDPDYVNNLIGFDLTEEEMISYFPALELEYDKETKMITVPTFRQDLIGMCDIAEEITRFYGYDKIPTTLPSGEATSGKLSEKLRIDELARSVALYCGFSQGMTYSFESPKVFDKLLLPEDSELRKTVTISNPLGEDFSVMRTTSLNGMLTSLATNYNRRNKDVRLFEMGNIYIPKALPVTDLPDERMQFTLGFYGDGDFFTMKGVVEEFLGQVGIDKDISYDAKAGKTFLHPGRQANVVYNGTVIGYLGEVHPTVCENYNMKTRAYVAVIDMPYIYEMANFDKKYEGIAKFPAVSRDISMVVPKEILVGDIEAVIKQRGGKILESYSLFDIYEGDQIKKGFKSVAYNIVFRAKDRTLEENDIAGAMKKILNGLERLGIQLRG